MSSLPLIFPMDGQVVSWPGTSSTTRPRRRAQALKRAPWSRWQPEAIFQMPFLKTRNWINMDHLIASQVMITKVNRSPFFCHMGAFHSPLLLCELRSKAGNCEISSARTLRSEDFNQVSWRRYNIMIGAMGIIVNPNNWLQRDVMLLWLQW